MSSLRSLGLWLVAVKILSNSTEALAMPDLFLFGVGNMANLEATNLPDPLFTRGSLGLGEGFGLEFRFGKWIGLEVDALYVSRNINQDFSSLGVVKLESKYFNLPVQLSLHLGRYLFISGGVYAAAGIGSVTLTDPAGEVVQSSFSDAQLIRTDLGVVFSAGFNIPINSWASLTLQGRYQRGLKNVGFEIPADSNIQFSDLMSIVGLKIAFSKK